MLKRKQPASKLKHRQKVPVAVAAVEVVAVPDQALVAVADKDVVPQDLQADAKPKAEVKPIAAPFVII